MDIYTDYQSQSLSDYNVIASDVYTSKFAELNLKEYCTARMYHCTLKHSSSPCDNCQSMINAAKMVWRDGVVSLPVLFRASVPKLTYHSVNAKRRLLQMPLVIFRVKKSQKHQSELFVMEKVGRM